MNTISPSASSRAIVSRPAPAAGRTATVAEELAPSAIVALSQRGLAAAKQVEAAADTAKPRMPASALFRDMGAAMLETFKTGALPALDQTRLPDDLDNVFTLGIITRSGKKVDLSLASKGDEVLVRISADAELNDDERKALSALAGGFQDAISGMAMDEPKLRLGELARFDSKVLGSIDLHMSVTLPTVPPAMQSLDFHIDDDLRTARAAGPSGTLELSVDTSMRANLGTRHQQEKAIDSYLKQFGKAAERGRGDPQLMGMFKDVFSDLSRTATRDSLNEYDIARDGPRLLSRQDHALLTGLADFSAGVSQTPQWNNPLHREEVKSFQYEVSQESRVGGDAYDDRSVEQLQKSRLTAQFHEPLRKGARLNFDYTSASQNYSYHQIDDNASSKAELGYKDGRLQKARLEQSVIQSERIREYVQGRMKSDRTIPAEQQLVRNLLKSLEPYQTDRKGGDQRESSDAREERRQNSLDVLSGNTALLGTCVDLGGRERRLQQAVSADKV